MDAVGDIGKEMCCSDSRDGSGFSGSPRIVMSDWFGA